MLHRRRADVVRELHALDLLRVFTARAAFSTVIASWAPGHASNHPFVNVVGSPTIRSEACVPIESSRPTLP